MTIDNRLGPRWYGVGRPVRRQRTPVRQGSSTMLTVASGRGC